MHLHVHPPLSLIYNKCNHNYRKQEKYTKNYRPRPSINNATGTKLQTVRHRTFSVKIYEFPVGYVLVQVLTNEDIHYAQLHCFLHQINIDSNPLLPARREMALKDHPNEDPDLRFPILDTRDKETGRRTANTNHNLLRSHLAMHSRRNLDQFIAQVNGCCSSSNGRGCVTPVFIYNYHPMIQVSRHQVLHLMYQV